VLMAMPLTGLQSRTLLTNICPYTLQLWCTYWAATFITLSEVKGG